MDPTQQGLYEKPNQNRTCQEGTGEKRPEQYIPNVPNQNKPARTDQTKLKRTAWARADLNRTMRPEPKRQAGLVGLGPVRFVLACFGLVYYALLQTCLYSCYLC